MQSRNKYTDHFERRHEPAIGKTHRISGLQRDIRLEQAALMVEELACKARLKQPVRLSHGWIGIARLRTGMFSRKNKLYVTDTFLALDPDMQKAILGQQIGHMKESYIVRNFVKIIGLGLSAGALVLSNAFKVPDAIVLGAWIPSLIALRLMSRPIRAKCELVADRVSVELNGDAKWLRRFMAEELLGGIALVWDISRARIREEPGFMRQIERVDLHCMKSLMWASTGEKDAAPKTLSGKAFWKLVHNLIFAHARLEKRLAHLQALEGNKLTFNGEIVKTQDWGNSIRNLNSGNGQDVWQILGKESVAQVALELREMKAQEGE